MTTPLPVQSGVTLASCSDTHTELLHREPSAFSTVLMHPEYLLLGNSFVLPKIVLFVVQLTMLNHNPKILDENPRKNHAVY